MYSSEIFWKIKHKILKCDTYKFFFSINPIASFWDGAAMNPRPKIKFWLVKLKHYNLSVHTQLYNIIKENNNFSVRYFPKKIHFLILFPLHTSKNSNPNGLSFLSITMYTNTRVTNFETSEHLWYDRMRGFKFHLSM